MLKKAKGRLSSICKRLLLEYRILRLIRSYPKALDQIRKKVACGGKVKVLFIVTELAKWKAQSVFDVLRTSDLFEPYIGISKPDRCYCSGQDAQILDFDACVAFFRKKGMDVARFYDPVSGQAKRIVAADADVIFYQQSWFDVKGQMPIDVCTHALCCYIPYYVPNYGDVRLDCQLPLHRMVYLHFMLNETWVGLYKQKTNKARRYAGKIVGLGHPMLDSIVFDPEGGASKQCVIYAPHWTINPNKTPGGLNYATFLWNGKEILSYAKQHREMNWVFKPHPNLAKILQYFAVMSNTEVEEYYNEWGGVGSVMLQGDYQGLFHQSSVMITDCGSFLTEYAATGKPIIHLVSSGNTHEPMAPSAELYSTYYQVHNLDEMYKIFREVLEERLDPKMAERHAAVRKAKLVGGNAGEAIAGYLETEIKSSR